MGSPIIGRTACPECGFAAAHVKQSEKCLFRYCPECGAQHFAKTEQAKMLLLDKTRLVDASPTATATPAPAPAEPEPPADPLPTGSDATDATATATAAVAPRKRFWA